MFRTLKAYSVRTTQNVQIILCYLDLQVFLRRFSFAIAILPHILFPGSLVGLKRSNLLRIHMLGHLIRLPFLEREPEPLVAVILIIRLILVVLYADEVTVYGFRIKRESDEGADRGGLGNYFEGPRLWYVSSSRMHGTEI